VQFLHNLLPFLKFHFLFLLNSLDTILFDMMETNENELLEELRKKGALSQPIFHSFLTAVSSDLEPMQRIVAMHFLEQQLLNIATINQFQTYYVIFYYFSCFSSTVFFSYSYNIRIQVVLLLIQYC